MAPQAVLMTQALANRTATPAQRSSLLATPIRVTRGARRAAFAPQAAGNGAVAVADKAGTALARSVKDDVEIQYLNERANHVNSHFPTALGVDDFMQRLEVALFAEGFANDNSIACVNLCRDEVTHALKHKIDQVFGSSFSTHGLGGVLTCGVTGIGAGLSHSPVCEGTGKERYVFFSFPHIAIDSKGVVGNISRPGRPAMSCACGALIKALGEFQREGISCNCKTPGVHEPLDTEYSILKQRLARKLDSEGVSDDSVGKLDLVELTNVAERVISSDLEFLISKAVDVNKADYAVVTGVQIHNWATEFDDDEPNLEWVAPVNVYAVVNGVKKTINLSAIPALTPRQIRLLASAPDAHTPSYADAESMVCNAGGSSTLREIDPPYMYNSQKARRQLKERLQSFALLADADKQLPSGSRQVAKPAAAPAAPAAAAPAAAPAAAAPAAAPAAAAASPEASAEAAETRSWLSKLLGSR